MRVLAAISFLFCLLLLLAMAVLFVRAWISLGVAIACLFVCSFAVVVVTQHMKAVLHRQTERSQELLRRLKRADAAEECERLTHDLRVSLRRLRTIIMEFQGISATTIIAHELSLHAILTSVHECLSTMKYVMRGMF